MNVSFRAVRYRGKFDSNERQKKTARSREEILHPYICRRRDAEDDNELFDRLATHARHGMERTKTTIIP